MEKEKKHGCLNWFSALLRGRGPLEIQPYMLSDYNAIKKRSKQRPMHCSMCGHVVAAGDWMRFIFGYKTINFFVCEGCDVGTDDLLRARFAARIKDRRHAADAMGWER